LPVKQRPLEARYRYLLFPLALFYWGVIFWRNLFYTVGFFVSHKLPCTVVSVGNLTVGGTGKTPAVIYLARLLMQYGHKVAVLSRGYGRSTVGTVLVSDGQKIINDNWVDVGDEPALMTAALPGVPIVVDENRYRGGQFIVQKFNPHIILLDDAFQHRSLERDVDLVLINSQDNKYAHKLIPYGILREPWFHLRRADLLLFTKANLKKPSPFLLSKARQTRVPYYYSTLVVGETLPGINNSNLNISTLSGRTIIAVSAVGDPRGFERSLKSTGAQIAKHLVFPDHHRYTATDLRQLKNILKRTKAQWIVTTEKDLVKFKAFPNVDLPLYALPVKFKVNPKGERALLKTILNAV
jgi:tetraacyldisaccharide 4'-kinase